MRTRRNALEFSGSVVILASAALVSAAMLTACTSAKPKPSSSSSTDTATSTGRKSPFTELKVDSPATPAMLRATELSTAIGGSLLAKAASIPYAFGGAQQSPDKPAVPTVWLSDDGKKWTSTFVDPKFAGSFTGGLYGDEKHAVLAGTQWQAGAETAVAWTSTDRRKWTKVSIPTDFAKSHQITAATVAGASIILAGRTNTGVSGGVVVTGANSSTFSLDAGDQADKLVPVSVAAAGANLVILGRPFSREGKVDLLGGTHHNVAYRSTDSGKTWSGPTLLGTTNDAVNGLVSTGPGFLATGARWTPDENYGYSLGAWSSTDGVTWTAETVPKLTGKTGTGGGSVALLSPSLGDSGQVAVLAASSGGYYNAVVRRSPDGQWHEVADSSTNSAPNAVGSAVPIEGGAILVDLGGAGAWRVATLTDHWTDDQTISPASAGWTSGTASTGSGGLLLPFVSDSYVPDAAGKLTHQTRAFSAELSPDGKSVNELKLDPPGFTPAFRETRTVDGDAALVTGLVVNPDGRSVTLSGYFRSAPTAAWVPITGLPTNVAGALMSAPTKVGGQWFIVGTVRQGLGDAPTPTVLTSGDGVTFTAGGAVTAPSNPTIDINGLCQGPGGKPFLVGSVGSYAGQQYTQTPAAWVSSGAGWTFLDAKGLGAGGDYNRLESCSSDGTKVVVQGTRLNDPAYLGVYDGTAWKMTAEGATGTTVGAPQAVGGGFVAPGSAAIDGGSTPALWLSRDGTTWSAVQLRAITSGPTDVVAASGKDLVVTMSPSQGNPIMVVRDIASVIDKHAK